MKNSIETIGNRTRDLPACSAVPQPTTRPPLFSFTHPYKRVVTFKAPPPPPPPFIRIFLPLCHCSIFCWVTSFATNITNPYDNVATFGTFLYAAWIEMKFFCFFSSIFHFNLSIGPDWRNLTDAVPSRTAPIGLLPPTVKWTIFCNGFILDSLVSPTLFEVLCKLQS